MRILPLLLTAFTISAVQLPLIAKDEEEPKKSRKEMKDEKNKKEADDKKKEEEEKKKADKEKNKAHYVATFSTVAAPTDVEAVELKSLLNTGNTFVCDAVTVEEGKLSAAIHNNIKDGRLSKATVNKVSKANTKFRLEKLQEKKEEKEDKKEKDSKESKDSK